MYLLKCFFKCIAFILVAVPIGAQTDDVYNFPVKPDMKEWSKLIKHNEMVEVS